MTTARREDHRRGPRTGLAGLSPAIARSARHIGVATALSLLLMVALSSAAAANAPNATTTTSAAVFAAARAQGASTPASTPAASPTPDAPRLTLTFDELNDSGVRGNVTLFPQDERTFVQIAVTNVAGNHPAHIHTGTCGEIDPEPEFPLANVDAEGRSDTVLEVPLDTLLDGGNDYVVDIHLSPTELGTLIACAEIDGELTNAAGTPVASPAASPSPASSPSPSPSPTETATATATSTTAPEPTAEPTDEPTETPSSGTGGNQIIPSEPAETATATATATATEMSIADRAATEAAIVSGTTEETRTPTATPAATATEATSDGTGGAIMTDDAGKGDSIDDAIGDAISDGTDGANMSDAGGVTAGKGEVAIDLDGVGGSAGALATVTSGKGDTIGDTIGDAVGDGSGGSTMPTLPALDIIASGKGDTVDDAVGGTGGDSVTVTVSGPETTSLPRQAGVGTAFDFPDNPLAPAMWATGLFALVLGAAGLFIRRGERAGRRHSGSLPRWVRLGL